MFLLLIGVDWPILALIALILFVVGQFIFWLAWLVLLKKMKEWSEAKVKRASYIIAVILSPAIVIGSLALFMYISIRNAPRYSYHEIAGHGLTSAQKLFPVSFDSSREYTIAGLDSMVDHFGEMLPIQADLSVVNWGEDPYGMYAIRFSEAKVKGDTIYVHIHETNTVYDYDYDLKITDQKFSANFWYQVTIDSAVRKIETLESKLTLKTKDFKTGDFLVGYIEYKGKCVSFFDKDEIYVVRGTFKVRLE